MRYKVGDRVRIVNQWPADGSAFQNPFGKMDNWLGKVMTIKVARPNYYQMVEDNKKWYWYPGAIAGIEAKGQKIVITTDGVTTLARLYYGKNVVKRAEAKCSTDDSFKFEVGACLAIRRLLGEKPKPQGFNKAMLCNGVFGRVGAADWFVVVDGRLVYEDGNYDVLTAVGADGTFQITGRKITQIVEAMSFRDAREVGSSTRTLLWSAE